MTQNDSIIEGAYLAGYEPSRDNLTRAEMLNEAIRYLNDLSKSMDDDE